uniref:Uncharacterized protein n=1 Tax=Candidozyma auris TaxID=498019 RepID=A0A0L0NSZ0_CANAR
MIGCVDHGNSGRQRANELQAGLVQLVILCHKRRLRTISEKKKKKKKIMKKQYMSEHESMQTKAIYFSKL